MTKYLNHMEAEYLVKVIRRDGWLKTYGERFETYDYQDSTMTIMRRLFTDKDKTTVSVATLIIEQSEKYQDGFCEYIFDESVIS